MTTSRIEWTDSTWNPTTGCDHISPGCDHCYAETLSRRLRAMGQAKYATGFSLALHPATLDTPLEWRKPRNIFVNSMSDLFHVDVPLDFIQRVFATMRKAHWHRFQILTKRSGRLLALAEQIDWPPNVLMGVSVESEQYTSRIDHLRKTGAITRFLSLEPLLGPLDHLDLTDIHWVIVGGESGPAADYLSVSKVGAAIESPPSAIVPELGIAIRNSPTSGRNTAEPSVLRAAPSGAVKKLEKARRYE